MFNKLLVILLFGLELANGDTCPSQTKITINDGPSGVLPSGATSPVQFDRGTRCTYWFDLPIGYAIQMKLSTVYPSDSVEIDDYVKFDYFVIPSGADNRIEWYMGPDLFVTLDSITGNLTFFATYTYIDISSFSQVLKKTGEYFNSTLEPNKFYTIQADVGETVTYNTATRNIGGTDPTLREVFIFDGPDIINSEYYGRMSQFTKTPEFQSGSNTLTFLNLYGSPSDTVVLGGDFSKLVSLPQYNLFLMDPNALTTGVFHNRNLRDTDAYYTFICDGCDYFYVQQLQFVNRSVQAPEGAGYVEIGGMTPSQGLPIVLNYSWVPETDLSLPQLIPTPVATFHSYKSNINFIMSTTAHLGYYNAGDSRIRTVSSPTLWNPQSDPNFDLTFSDPVKFFNFSLNIQTVNIVGDTDLLSVEVGSTDGTTSLQKKFQKGSVGGVKAVGVGNYLHLKYSGGKDSQVVVSFEELEMGLTTDTVTTTVTQSTSTRAPVTSTVTPTTTRTPTAAPTPQPTQPPVPSTSPPISTTLPVTTTVIPAVGSTVGSTVGFTVPSTQGTSTIATTTRAASGVTVPLTILSLMLAIFIFI